MSQLVLSPLVSLRLSQFISGYHFAGSFLRMSFWWWVLFYFIFSLPKCVISVGVCEGGRVSYSYLIHPAPNTCFYRSLKIPSSLFFFYTCFWNFISWVSKFCFVWLKMKAMYIWKMSLCIYRGAQSRNIPASQCFTCQPMISTVCRSGTLST